MDEKTKHKQQQIIELISSFCDDVLDDEYKRLSIALVEKMGRKHDVPFKRGKLEIWASAVIYALGQINFLFDKDFEPYATPDEICEYFGTKKSTVSDKARKIRDMFNMAPFDREFSTSYVSGEAPQMKIDGKSGLIVPASDMDVFFEQVYDLTQDEKFDEAIDMLDSIDEDSPEYFRALFYKSMILGMSGDEENAMNLFEKSLSALGDDLTDFDDDEAIDFDNPDDLFAAGLSHYILDDYAGALEFFDLSLKLNPNQSEALYYKACSLGYLNEFKKALKVIDKAIKIDSQDDRFWNERGNFLTRLNYVDKAIKSFNKALKLAPEDSTIWANKGFLYLENEKYDKALECYDKACKLAPGHIHPIIGKANVFIGKEDFETAETYLNEASQIDDEDLEYLDAMAGFMLAQERHEDAIAYWDKSLEINDENPMIWLQKAISHAMIDEDEEFERCMDKAVEIDPGIMYAVEDLMNEMGG